MPRKEVVAAQKGIPQVPLIPAKEELISTANFVFTMYSMYARIATMNTQEKFSSHLIP